MVKTMKRIREPESGSSVVVNVKLVLSGCAYARRATPAPRTLRSSAGWMKRAPAPPVLIEVVAAAPVVAAGGTTTSVWVTTG